MTHSKTRMTHLIVSSRVATLLLAALVAATTVLLRGSATSPLTAAEFSSPGQAADHSARLSQEIVQLGSDELVAGIQPVGTDAEQALTLAEIKVWLDDPRNHRRLGVRLPLGLAAGAAQLEGFDDNPLTRAKIELGRQLFFDGRLSKDHSLSCASCHDPQHAFADNKAVSLGIDQQPGGRNAPVAYNRILSARQFWDGRAASLEAQAVGPIANTVEMANTHDACVECLRAVAGYRLQFERIFEEGVTIENVARAIASFERTIVTGPTPWDRHERLASFEKAYAADLEELDLLEEDDPDLFDEYVALSQASKATPVSEAAKRGGELFFGKANCSACHNGANYTDELYHNVGVGMQVESPDGALAESPDWGRFDQTQAEEDRGAFKTPTLRNVAQTAPYMHDGSLATLAEVIDWYDGGGQANRWQSPDIEPLGLSDREKLDLVEFLKALTGRLPKVERGRLPE